MSDECECCGSERNWFWWIMRELFAGFGVAVLMLWLLLHHYGAHWCTP